MLSVHSLFWSACVVQNIREICHGYVFDVGLADVLILAEPLVESG